VTVRTTLIYNPSAGDEQHGGEELVERLDEAGYDAVLVSDRKRLERRLEDPGELVVVAGGDGSVKAAALALAGRGVPLAILPMGTANNIAKSLGIMGSVTELIARWRGAKRRRLRVGSVTGPWGTQRFVESAGVGLFAELVTRGREEVDENAAGLTGHAIDRALLLLQRIMADQAPRVRRVTLDGTDLSGEYLLVEAMNIPLIGPNIPLAPGADWSDGLLDLVLVTERERDALADYLRARIGGAAAPLELPVRQGRRVVLRASPSELHVDDDAWKPKPQGGTTSADVAVGEVSIGLGAEDEGVAVLLPETDPPQAPRGRGR
jgi:diacylglycerol kinase family enzyme